MYHASESKPPPRYVTAMIALTTVVVDPVVVYTANAVAITVCYEVRW
jgi:hypothetical protein